MAGIDPKFYYLTLGLLALCTVVGLVVAYRLQREVNNDLAPPTERDLLGPLEKAYYSGLMREEEFEKIQESMARHQAGDPSPMPKRSAKPPTAGPSTTEDAPPEVIPPGDSDPGLGPG